jgi:protein-disulfide isomerase
MNAKSDPRPPSETTTRRERRAAERAARKGGPAATTIAAKPAGPSMLVISAAAVAIALVVIVALILVSGGLGGDSVKAISEPDVPAPPQELRVGRSLGDPEAPVVVEAFEDPQCPACGLYTERIEPLLVGGPVSDGTVFLTYRDFPFIGQESIDAAIALRAAEALDGKFWDYHTVLFHNQDGENKGAFSRERLGDIAELVGLDRTAFLEALDDPQHLAAVEAERAEGAARGVNSTPTIFVNGQLMRGVPTWEDLSAAIAAAAAASPAPAASGAPAASAASPAPAASATASPAAG